MKYSSNSILSFIPSTKEGELILRQSLLFQKVLEKRIFITDIIKPVSALPKLFQSKARKSQQREAENTFHHFVKDVLKKEIPKEIILRVKSGKPVPTLINQSKNGGYEFIIIDKSSDKYPGALSQAEINNFISKSHCPVLTINKNTALQDIHTIVVPIDISQTTKKRLFWASLFAKKFDAKILIVSVLNINIEETKSLAYKNAEKIKKMLLKRGIECEVKILKTHKHSRQKVLLDYIEKRHPELVIIRTHQESRFTGKKIGKFVSDIIHGCKIPVFAVSGATKTYPVDL